VNCMKCGIELKGNAAFCPECLEDMEKYPVKPNIKVQIPHRPAPAPVRKKAKKNRYPKPEDQIRHLKKVRNWLTGLVIFLLAALGISIALLLFLLVSGKVNPAEVFGTMVK